ncbi:DedA family protein [Cryptosporangium phraense]|uniref:DedA family protein n=1 Tax=Cryptosporangium phraense TaxID=2593070 RepID=UPI001478E914|nr:DedA family protein [Cryptosporangium phraense]
MQSLLDGILSLPAPLVVVLAALILAGEPALLAGIVLPSVSTALGLGFLASAGLLNLPLSIATATVAVILGDATAYALGRRRATTSFGRRWARLQRATERASALLGRHGGRAVFAARWVVGARTLVPRLAGAGGVAPGRFLVHSVPAGVLWSGFFVGAGYLAGSSYRQVSAAVGPASLGMVLLGAALIAGVLAGRWLGRHPDRPARLLARVIGDRSGRWLPPTALALALTIVGALLTVLVATGVHTAGLPRLDEPVSTLLDAHRVSWPVPIVTAVLIATPSYAVVAAAAALVLIRPVRSGRHRDPLGVLAAGGAVVPLVILTALINLAEHVGRSDNLFATQHAVSTTAIALATWTLARKRTRTGIVVATGTAVVVLLAAGRVYLGWGTISSTAAALLIGLAWAGVFVAAWTVTSRGQTAPESPAAELGDRAAPVDEVVVNTDQGFHLGPIVGERTRLGTLSTVQLEHVVTS